MSWLNGNLARLLRPLALAALAMSAAACTPLGVFATFTSRDPALRSAGAPVQEEHYPGVGHNEIMAAMSRPFRDRASVLNDITEFLRRETD